MTGPQVLKQSVARQKGRSDRREGVSKGPRKKETNTKITMQLPQPHDTTRDNAMENPRTAFGCHHLAVFSLPNLNQPTNGYIRPVNPRCEKA